MRNVGLPESCDLLVVGLGPGGSSAAAAAAAEGCSVVAVDRKRRAGFPVQCAEFVPAMIGQELSSVARVARQSIRSMVTFVEDQAPDLKNNFPGHMIDRVNLDAALVRQAEEDGADCRFGSPLAGILPGGCAVFSDGRKLRARFIIGADGPRSRIGRAIGQANQDLVETRQATVRLRQGHRATDIFLSADYTGGYGWLFPKGDRAHIGLGVIPGQRHRLKPLLQELHGKLVRKGRVAADVISYTGGPIPVGGLLEPQGDVAGTPVLLAGDAAGLTNPVTGAGISAAVISGKLAGQAAAAWLGGNGTALREYGEELEDTFAPALARALARRRDILQAYEDGKEPTPDVLRKGWVAYPEYWAA